MPDIALLHGMEVNLGDLLIRERAKRLLLEYLDVTHENISEFSYTYQNLDEESLQVVLDSDCVVIAGGPAYQPHFYPEVFPDAKTVLDAGIPIYPLGPGWRGKSVDEYTFSEESIEILRRIHENIKVGGARDIHTIKVLKKHGINNVSLSGCPAWYDLSRIDKSFSPPETISKIVVSTPPRGDFLRLPQTVYLLYRLSREFPDAQRIFNYHVGITSDTNYISANEARFHKMLHKLSSRLGYETFDSSGDVRNVKMYKDTDLHVGYRVHAHIPTLAYGNPSYLLQIDGRGTGVSESLGTRADVQAFRRMVREPVDNIITNVYRNHEVGYPDFRNVDSNIEHSLENMKEIIDSIQQRF